MLVAIAALIAADGVRAEPMRDSTVVTDGVVNALASTGATLYVGGLFSRVGPWTGGAGVVDRATGVPQKPYPRVAGTVLAVIADGSGGWFLGGSFSAVQGQARANLAHVLADGTLADWTPSANATVRALALGSGTLFLGGDFTTVAGQPRSHLAALNPTTGALSTWNPGTSGIVNAMIVNGTKLYAGGPFRFAGGQLVAGVVSFDLPTGDLSAIQPAGPEREGQLNVLHASSGRLYVGGSLRYAGPPTGAAAALDATTGFAQTPFLDVTGAVKAIASDGAGGWYVGGLFTAVRGQSRQNLAHVLADGTVAAWNPGASDTVQALAARNDTVYAGGLFTTCGGQTRAGLAALDAVSGSALSWDAHLGDAFFNPGVVNALQLDAGRLIVGGQFMNVGTVPRANVAAIRTDTGAADDTQVWGVDGPVRAVALSAAGLFVGGAFDLAAPPTLRIAQFDPTTGGALPVQWGTNGSVSAVEPDGAGGWYIGGLFSKVLGQPRSNLAHVLANGSLAPSLGAPNGLVMHLLLSGTTLYVGGAFNTAGGQPHAGLCAVDVTTGALTAWAPAIDAGHLVQDMVLVGDTLYVAGNFTSVNGQQRHCLAGIATSGALASFNPNVTTTLCCSGASVFAIAYGAPYLYLQGLFSNVGGAFHANLAAIDIATGAAIPWSPTINNSVRGALAIAGDTVFVGGDLSQVDGQLRIGLAALDRFSGALLPWNPALNGLVNTLRVQGGSLYVGGAFTVATGQRRKRLAAFERGTGVLLPWDPGADAEVWSLSVTPSAIGACGDFSTAGGTTRNNVAGFSAGSGAVLAFNPNANGAVNALAVSGTTVYMGGEFTTAGGTSRVRLAAQDLNIGQLPWTANVNAVVRGLAVTGGNVYAGGDFTAVSGFGRARLVALDAASAAVQPWDPEASGTVYAVASAGGGIAVGGDFVGVGGRATTTPNIAIHDAALVAAVDIGTGHTVLWRTAAAFGTARALLRLGNSVYVGGDFNFGSGTAARAHAAAFDATTGATLPWKPGLAGGGFDRRVRAFAASGDTVYMGGGFTVVNGQERPRLASVDATTGAVHAWTADADSTVYAIAVSGGQLAAGGEFSSMGMQQRSNVAAIDAVTGEPRPWAPSLNGSVSAFAIDGSRLFMSGAFTLIDGALQERLAVIDTSGGPPLTQDLAIGGTATAIVPAGGRIYIGGGFFDIGGVPRKHLAALDRTTLALLPWNPNPNTQVTSLAVVDGLVYAGGFFTTVGGATRRSLAALDTTSGLATSWDPNLNAVVNAIAVHGNTLFAGGDFTTVGGVSRTRLAAIDRTSGIATAWNPGANGAVNALAYANGVVFAGGTFAKLAGDPSHAFLAAVDETTGLPLSWSPSTNAGVNAILLSRGTLFAGGVFTAVGGESRRGLAGLADPSFNPLLGVTPHPERPLGLALAQNSPNPFNAASTIPFTLPRAGSVWLSLLDPAGRVVRTLIDGAVLEAGPHTFRLQSAGLAPGLYWCRLEWDGKALARRMVAVP